jgi:hypothetical protein
MKRRIKILKKTLCVVIFLAISLNISAQLKIKPAIIDIGSVYDKEFVLVIKANEKFEKPERVVMADFKADTVAFDPAKLNTYPRWRFSNFTLFNSDGSSTRYISLYCITTGKYLINTPAHGRKMIDQSEYDKIMKKDEQNKWVNSTDEIMRLFFKPIVEGEYIQLGIYNTKNENLVVTQMDWNTRLFKIVLVKY